MTRLLLGVGIGVVATLVLGAALGIHADDLDRAVTLDTIAAANEAGRPLVDVLGAADTMRMPARAYLISVGELPLAAPPVNSDLERLLDCLSWHESRHTPTALNPASGAAGQFQYLLSTWPSTPQGRAGLSRFDSLAARQATIWMIERGRLHEWSTWRLCA